MNTPKGRHRSDPARQLRRDVLVARSQFVYAVVIGALIAAGTTAITTAFVINRAWLLVAIALGLGTFGFLTVRDMAFVYGDRWRSVRRRERNADLTAVADVVRERPPLITPTRLPCVDDVPTDTFPAVLRLVEPAGSKR